MKGARADSVVIDRQPAANATVFLSLPPTVRGAMWRGFAPFRLPVHRAILSERPDEAPTAATTVAGARIRAACPTICTTTPAPALRLGRSPKHDLETWTVTDDCPARVPVTEAEVDVFEAWFGELFDELFGPCR
jgi:hypothetical protein